MVMSVESSDCDDDERGQGGGMKANIPDQDNDDDVLSLYAQSDYELDTEMDRKKPNNKPCDTVLSPFKEESASIPVSVNTDDKRSKKDKTEDKVKAATQRKVHSDRAAQSSQPRKKDRLKSDRGRHMRGRLGQLKRNRDGRNPYVQSDIRSVICRESSGTRSTPSFESRSLHRNMHAYGSTPGFVIQKRGILGDAPLIKGRASSLSQNQNPSFFGDDNYSFMHQHHGIGTASSLSGDRNVLISNETSWQSVPYGRSREGGRCVSSYGGLNTRSSILGDGALYQQRIQNYAKNGDNAFVKRRDSTKPLPSSRNNDKSSHQGRTQDFEKLQRMPYKRQRTTGNEKYVNSNKKVSKLKTKSDSGSKRTDNKYPCQTSVDRLDDSEYGKNERENSPTTKRDSHDKISNLEPLKSEITTKQIVKQEFVDKKVCLKTTDISSEESLPPTKKSRVALLPTPKSIGEWATKIEVASDKEDIVHERMSNEKSNIEFMGESSKSSKLDLTICAKRPPEKTATVAPLRSVAAPIPQSDASALADDSEPQQIDFLEGMVTPPIEVTYAIDAPPRPPNPGPTHMVSSNSNSPAASRPSSRSGRYIIYEQNRAATPDVPPRPVNPPPPVSAPSPASTPEGMPPRPQNPGPPLDVTLSAMSRPSLSANSSQSNHDRTLSFVDTSNSVPSLLPLPAHSKLPSQSRQPTLNAEPSPAHTSVTRVGLLESPTLTDVGVSASIAKSSVLCSTTSSYNTAEKSVKPLLALPCKVSEEKRMTMDQQKHIFMPNYNAIQRGTMQSVVMDLSKPSVTDANSSSSIISNSGQAVKTLQSESQAGKCYISENKESSRDSTKPSTTVSASLSFSTNVVSSSYPIQSSYLAPSVSSVSSRGALLPIPNADTQKEESSASKSEDSVGKLSKQSDLSKVTSSETVLKENIITCLRNNQYFEGLGALKDAISKMPDKFGDGEVYEVIEYFGQNDAFEHVVPAARLVSVPDERLLQFLVHVTEQAPSSFKEKDDELWLIFNQVLSINASPSAVDAFIKCFAAIGSWNKVWAALPLYGNSINVPPSTIAICLQAVATGQDDKHLRNGVLFLSSLPHHVKCALDADVVNSLWLRCAEKGLSDAVNEVDQVKKLIPQSSENNARLSGRVRTLVMELIVSGQLKSLSDFIGAVGQQYFQQYLDCFAAGFMVVDDPITKIGGFLKEIKQQRLTSSRNHEVFSASLCVMVMRHLSQRQAWAEAFELWRLAGELSIPCERAAALENESQTSIALLCLEICVRHGSFETAVCMLSESLVLGQPWNDVSQVRRRVCILQEIFYRTVETRLDHAAVAFRALLSTKDTDQAIIHEYGRLVDLMTVYNNYIVGACHSGDLDILTTALELISIAHHKHLIVKPTVLRYLVVACVRFKLHNNVKEFLQRGMTVSIYPTIDVHSNMLLLPTDLATEEIAALLLLYLMLLKEYLVQAMQVSKVGGESGSGGVDVHQACSITVVPNNVNTRDHEFTQKFQLASTEFGLLQRVQSILASGSGGSSIGREGMYNCHVDYLKSPISSELSFEGGRSVLKLNTTEVYNNVYYIEPPSD